MKVIDRFDGENEFLSNFYACKVEYEGLTYENVEEAFQSAKILYLDKEDTVNARKKFIGIGPGKAKRMGRSCHLRGDWDAVKDGIMEELVRYKFTSDEKLKQLLINTGDAFLIEGNTWHDNYWGDCACDKCKDKQGRNKLGVILMKVRSELIDG